MIVFWIYAAGAVVAYLFGDFKINDRPAVGLERVLFSLVWPMWLVFMAFVWVALVVVIVATLLTRGRNGGVIRYRGRIIYPK